ncbi:unnamed protein product [Pleuronectes platessa]|uniref:Uncharacterized protein n=1 Tax=Pleuronectes platessa TaxID=8262 RepID=A0A9N7VVN6_PLEPL|nr:unnamed protein product [Pleuronectes platessa]
MMMRFLAGRTQKRKSRQKQRMSQRIREMMKTALRMKMGRRENRVLPPLRMKRRMKESKTSIISPQENRLKKIHIIQEEAAEDEDDDKSGSKTGSSDREEFSEDDIENLLAPQQQTKKTDKDLKVDDKAKANCDNVEIFQVEDNSKKTDQQSDSDEIDDFYD